MGKKNVVEVVKEKAAGLVTYNEKDLAKLKTKTEKLKKDYEIHDLAYRYLSDPQNEELIKEVNSLDDKSKKALTKIANAKSTRLMIVAGSVVVLGAAGTMAVKASKKKPIDVDYEEVEDEESEEDDVEEDESVDETDDTPVEE